MKSIDEGRRNTGVRLAAAALTIGFIAIAPGGHALAQTAGSSSRGGRPASALPVHATAAAAHVAPAASTHAAAPFRALHVPTSALHPLPHAAASRSSIAARLQTHMRFRPMTSGTTIQFVDITNGNTFENGNYGGIAAVFTDSATPTPSASNYAATFDWGDGTVDSTAVGTASITCNDRISGQCELRVNGHGYKDEGTETVIATVYPAGSSASSPDAATDTGTLQVGEADAFTPGPAIPLRLTTANSFSGPVATFTNTGAAPNAGATDFTATIAWGDGQTSAGTVSAAGTTITVAGSHTYAGGGSFPVSVTLSDDAPGTATATVNTNAGTIQFLVITTGNIVEDSFVGGEAAAFVDGATSTPVASDYAASFDWGDGTVYSTTAGTASIACNDRTAGTCELYVSGHTYADEGTYTVTATVYPAGGSPTGNQAFTSTGVLTVTESDVLSAGTLSPIHVTEGQKLSATVATFTDSGYSGNPGSDFTAMIDWGDGSSDTGTVGGAANGGLTVFGTHTYVSAGSYTVSVTLNDDSPGTVTASGGVAVVVDEAPITWTASPTVKAVEGQPFTGTLATFTDSANNASCAANTYTATILWDDGSASTAGSVSVSGCDLTVSGSHAYLESGSYAPTVQLKENSTLAASHAAAIDVSDAPLSVSGKGTITVPVFSNTGLFTAADFTDTAGNAQTCASDTYSYSITYNGIAGPSGSVGGNSTCSGMVTDSRTFVLPGNYTVCTTVTDEDDGATQSTCGTTISVGYPLSTAPQTSAQRATASMAVTTPANFRISMTIGQPSLTSFTGGVLSYVDRAAGVNLTSCAVGATAVTQCRLTVAAITRSACAVAGAVETIFGTYTPAGSTTPLQFKFILVAGSAGTGSVQVTLLRPDGSVYTGTTVPATVVISC